MKNVTISIKKQLIYVIVLLLFTLSAEGYLIYSSLFNSNTRENPYSAWNIVQHNYRNPFIRKRLEKQLYDLETKLYEFYEVFDEINSDIFLGNHPEFRDTKDKLYLYIQLYSDMLLKEQNELLEKYRIRILSDTGVIISDNMNKDSIKYRNDIFSKYDVVVDAHYEDIFEQWIANDLFFTGHDYYDSILYPYEELNGKELIEAKEEEFGSVIRYSLDYSSLAVIYNALPFYIDNSFSGYILFSQSFYSLPESFLEWVFVILRFIILSIIIELPLLFFLIYRLVNPLTKLSQQTKYIIDKNGHIINTELFGINRNDEIGDLARAFSSMIKKINDRIHYVETFSSDIAHEFQNPLAAIKSSLELIDNPNIKRDDKIELLDNAFEEIKHLEMLLNSIRNISKIENQNNTDNTVRIDIISVTQNIIKRVKNNYPDIEFIFDYDMQNKEIVINPENFDRLVENLLDNAASFAINSKLKQVSINILDLLSPNEIAIGFGIIVEDSGKGVTPGEEKKIFNRFYSHRENEQRKNHSGLGLSTVKAIVDSMNGKIVIEKSEKLGGASFIIYLPIIEDIRQFLFQE